MKKCPVCGVMMGDNVARCSMCKYDFQKASSGEVDQAVKEAQSTLSKKEEEAIARSAEKKSEEEKHLAEIKQKITREIDTLKAQFESEKLRLDAEYAQLQRTAIDEKLKLEAELTEKRNELDDVRNYIVTAKKDIEKYREEGHIAALKEHDEMIDLAKKEQQRIMVEAQQQTEELARRVEIEYNEAMKKRDDILTEAKELQEFVDKSDKIMAEKAKETEELEARIKKLQEAFEAEKIRIEEESKKVSLEQASEAVRIKEQADAERRAIDAEKKEIIADIEKRRADAQVELDGLVSQAKQVIEQAEEATKQRDEMNKIIEEARALEIKKGEYEKQITEYEAQATTWTAQIDSLKNKYDEAQRIIADSKTATVTAQAIAQEIILDAEKKSVFLKEVALSESDKGRMLKQIEEKEQQIKDMEKQKDELVAKITQMEEAIADLNKKIKEAATAVSIADSGNKEYVVEVVKHNSNGEVDSEGINHVLQSRSNDGWKLSFILNDEGGKLQAALGSSESNSLSVGAYSSKEDRVVLIFERAKKK